LTKSTQFEPFRPERLVSYNNESTWIAQTSAKAKQVWIWSPDLESGSE